MDASPLTGYPRGLKVDFNKLRPKTLKRYAWYYNLPCSSSLKTAELACVCANHFCKHFRASEHQVMDRFADFCKEERKGKDDSSSDNGDKKSNGHRSRSNGNSKDEHSRKRSRVHPFPVGDKVAAKIVDEYMLTRIIKHSKRKKMYKVEDADELTEDPAQYDVSQDHVIVIPKAGQPETLGREYPRGARVLALFPGTSVFYPATVAKKIKKPKGKLVEYGLRFDDDEKEADGEVRIKKISVYDVVAPPLES